jgi:two-component system response regulator FlrC
MIKVVTQAPITISWIDSTQVLADNQLAAFAGSGLKVSQIELSDVMTTSADVVVMRTADDLSQLKSLIGQMADADYLAPLIIRAGVDQFELGIEAMRVGAATVVPAHLLDATTWLSTFKKLNVSSPKQPNKSNGFVFVDPTSRKLLALTERVAQAEVSVLLAGPTGAGKEVLARILHDSSPRHAGPFIAFNCAAMPENLVEDMLFGHEKGSFTGATKVQAGLFEQAQGGTIFLDEIGEMSYHLQAKLLRILQERRVTRLGGQQEIELNIKVVAATNRDLKEAIFQRTFREDLYFRLSAFKITIPSLRERPMDIMPLSEQILLAEGHQDKAVKITKEAAQQLVSYHWPGNVRELQNVIIRANILAQNGRIDAHHLIFDDLLDLQVPSEATGSDELVSKDPQQGHDTVEKIESLSQSIRNSEHRRIMDVLQSSTSRDQAAKILGISPRTLRHKLQRFREDGIDVMRAYAR